VTEDTQGTCEERDLLPVTMNVLIFQEFDDRLRSRQTDGCHTHSS
jgi:hypothetical protein